MNTYVDFHVLQTVPPSCINRDDMGSPKTAVYGGAVRARVSSQAWKRAIRIDFKSLFPKGELAYRTKYVVEMVEKEMFAISPELDKEQCHKRAVDALSAAGIPLKSKKNETEKAEALFFMSVQQARAIANHALSYDLNDKATKDILKNDLKNNPSVDIALFGRMAASDPTLNYDAAVQVAHAISTHAVENEYDYFTAVDDLQADDNAGAGHLGTVEFNSSTLYRYATVNASELVKTLGKDMTAEGVRKFGQSFICSMPTGHENTFANRTLPDTVYITIRTDQPVNLCGAFEAPVKKSDKGFAFESEKKLSEYAEKVYNRFAARPIKAFSLSDTFGEDTKVLSLNSILEELEKELVAIISEV